MRRYQKVKVTEEKYVVDSVVCNKCGKEIPIRHDEFDQEGIYGFSVCFGFGSKYDLEKWSWDLCESCLEDLVFSFKHMPAGIGVELGVDYDDKGVEFLEWYKEEQEKIWEERKAKHKEGKMNQDQNY